MDETSTDNTPFPIANESVPAGTRRVVGVPVPGAYGNQDLSMQVVVCHGRRPGPRVFLSAAVHGDEIMGVEIIRRVLQRVRRKRLRGTLVAVPVVNVFGFMDQSRYLPDRRDLNRCFPGSARGSMAARLAHVFMHEVVQHCSHGIDLHTGAIHRENLPQIRAAIDHPPSRAMAEAFGVPVVLASDLRDGSLRAAVRERDIPIVLYEGGEALRLDEHVIRAGVQGVLQVLIHLGVLAAPPRRIPRPAIARSSLWLRAPRSGLMRLRARLGQNVAEGDRLGVVTGPMGEDEEPIIAPAAGIVIGRQNLPLVNEGDGVLHLACFDDPVVIARIADRIDGFAAVLKEGLQLLDEG